MSVIIFKNIPIAASSLCSNMPRSHEAFYHPEPYVATQYWRYVLGFGGLPSFLSSSSLFAEYLEQRNIVCSISFRARSDTTDTPGYSPSHDTADKPGSTRGLLIPEPGHMNPTPSHGREAIASGRAGSSWSTLRPFRCPTVSAHICTIWNKNIFWSGWDLCI